MRSVVTALAIVALLVIWRATQYSDDIGQNPTQRGRDVALFTMPQETGSAVVDQVASQEALPDEAISDAIESNDLREPTMQTAEVEFGPEMRAGIVAYFSRSGLALVDSERIADSVLDGLGACVGLAFGGDEEPTSNSIETCMFDVFADYGIVDLPVGETELAISLH